LNLLETVCLLLQRLFDDCHEIGELMYRYIAQQHGSLSTGLSAAEYSAGVRNIVDLGGESYPMDFYFKVFSGRSSLTQHGVSLLLL